MRALVLLICGCNSLLGVHDFDPPDGPTEPTDGARIDAPASTTCLDRWLAGTAQFGPAAPLDLGNLGRNDRDPAISDDGKTLYYSSQRQDYDIFQWTTDGSVLPQRVTAFNSPSDETKVTVRSDGLQVIVARSQTGSDPDLLTASRSSPTGSFGPFSRMDDVDTTFAEYDPQFVGIGDRLYFSRADSDGQHVYKVSRTRISGAFGAPTKVIADVAADPWASADERLVVFSRQVGTDPGDLYYQVANVEQKVPDLNTSSAEGDPSLTADACTIYFASNRNSTGLQIFRATMAEL